MAILATEKILTLDYWKPASKIEPGDYVFDLDGKPSKVKLVQTFHSPECYEVQFDDHLQISGDQNLTLPTENKSYRYVSWSYKGKRKFTSQLKRHTAKDFTEIPLRKDRNRLEYSVPTSKPLQFPHQNLTIPPFLFGYWFFNAQTNRKMSPPPNTEDKIYAMFKDFGYKVEVGRLLPNKVREFSVTPTLDSQFGPTPPDKIPANYLLSSSEQRLELLKGILASKSRTYNPRTDRFRFTSKYQRVIRQIQFLAESLGLRTSLTFDDTYHYYTLSFRSRLQLTDNQNSPRLRVHPARRYITNVRKLPPQMCVHIQTETNFLVGEGFIPCY